MPKLIAPPASRYGDTVYQRYLLSDHWRNTRNSALMLAGYRCSVCEATADLEVHHVTYATLGKENVATDLRVLCRSCHELEHQHEWIRTRKGNWTRLHGDLTITVFQRSSGLWDYVVDGVFGGYREDFAARAMHWADQDYPPGSRFEDEGDQ